MAGKPNIRSIRFSDELAELIDRQAGNTFTEKFENLVTRCVWELPQKEAKLKEVQKQVRQEEKRLAELRKRREKLDQAMKVPCPITKFKGKTLGEVLQLDPGAIKWVAEKFSADEKVGAAAQFIRDFALQSA